MTIIYSYLVPLIFIKVMIVVAAVCSRDIKVIYCGKQCQNRCQFIYINLNVIVTKKRKLVLDVKRFAMCNLIIHVFVRKTRKLTRNTTTVEDWPKY